MTTQSLLALLTGANLALLSYQSVRPRALLVSRPDVPAVIRARALEIGGESDPTYIQIKAEGGESTVKLINEKGVERLIQP